MFKKLLAPAFLISSLVAPIADGAVEASKVGENLYMLTGQGGNIGVMIGEDGTFMIDDQFAPLSEEILQTIEALGGEAPRFLINTHFHGDHTGGNNNFGRMHAVIVAHTNVRKRLAEGAYIKAFDMTLEPQPHDALPSVTYSQGVDFHLNGDTISVKHIPAAHTDGDSIIHFHNANVLHAGDTFFNGFFPFIDTDHGGTIVGVIAAVDHMLSLADDETKIIPGHGPLAAKPQLQSYRNMLALAQQRLAPLKAQGLSVDQAVAAQPLQDLDPQWGNAIFTADKWITIVWDGL